MNKYNCDGIVAQRNIAAGEHLFTETAFVWARDSISGDENVQAALTAVTCEECGVFNTSCECESCGARYCSDACRNEAYATHHLVLCSKNKAGNGAFMQQGGGHSTCALKVIAKIILDLQKRLQTISILHATKEEVESSMLQVVGYFFKPAFTKAIHAFRGGKTLSDDMFEAMFQASYFDGYLRDKFNSMQSMFPVEVYGRVFVDTCLSEVFYDSLMGMFLVNNQRVCIEHEGHTLTGTALYYTYCKTNHSCIPNMVVGPIAENALIGTSFTKVGIRVTARTNIAMGDEIKNCYLSQGSGRGLTLHQRRTELSQYLFECECTLCEEEHALTFEDADY